MGIRKLIKYIVVFIPFVIIPFIGITGYGGWNVIGHLSLADIFTRTAEFKYLGMEGEFFPSCPVYFPGFSIIAVIIDKISFSYAIYLIQFCAGLNVLVYLITSIIIVKSYIKDTNFVIVYSPLILFTFFQESLWYAYDFKPDIFLLVLFNIYIILQKKNIKPIIRYFPYFLIITIGIITKQQFLGILAIILFDCLIKRNFKLFIFLTSSSVIVVFLLFWNVENLFFYTLETMKQQSLFSIPQIGNIINSFIINKWIIILIIILLLTNSYKSKKVKFYFYISLMFWSLLLFISTLKSGGTIENLTSGTLIFFPFIIIFLYKSLYNPAKFKKIILLLGIVLNLSIFTISGAKTWIYYNSTTKNIPQVVDYLNVNFNQSTVLYDSSPYSILRLSSLIPLTDINSVTHLKRGGADMKNFLSSLNDNKYDLLVLRNKAPKDFFEFETIMHNKYEKDTIFTINKDHSLSIYKIKAIQKNGI
jgi:hypothetical protein